MAFGVVWWSVATILTPVAAKIGLPFLLVVRALMGIGEVDFCSIKLVWSFCISVLAYFHNYLASRT